jgi:hypothetical protein
MGAIPASPTANGVWCADASRPTQRMPMSNIMGVVDEVRTKSVIVLESGTKPILECDCVREMMYYIIAFP